MKMLSLFLLVALALTPARIAKTDQENSAKAWLEKALQYLDEGRTGAALETLEDVLRVDPASSEARRRRAVARILQHDFDAALSELRLAEELPGKEGRTASCLGFVLFELGDKDAARAAYRASIRHDPAHALAMFLECLRRDSCLTGKRNDFSGEVKAVKRLARHIDFFRTSLGVHDGDIPTPDSSLDELYRESRYERLVALRDLAKLERGLKRYLRSAGDWVGMQRQSIHLETKRALIQLDLRLYEEVIQTLEAAYRNSSLPPANDAVLLCRTFQASALAELGREREAVTMLRDVLRIDYRFVWAQYYLGRSLEDQGNYRQAIAAYKQALLLDPELNDVDFRLGNCHGELGEFEAALNSYTRAILYDNPGPEVYNNVGTLLLDGNARGEAIENFEKAIELNPRYTDAWFNLGRAHESVGRRDLALVAYEKALAIDAEHADANNNIGTLLSDQGRGDESPTFFRRALASEPGHVEARFNLGSSLKSMREFEEAAAQFKQLVELTPEDPAAWRELGICHEKRALLDDACVALERSSKLDANDFNTWYFLARIYKAQGRRADAQRAFHRMKVLNPALAEALE